MEAEILQELETIRSYLSIIMTVLVIFIVGKIVESAQKIFIGFKTVWNVDFRDRMISLQEQGDFQEIIDECEEKLRNNPNHVDANWFMALAYYYTENNDKATAYFEKSIYLTPSWEESANEYLEKIKSRS